jgi:N-acetylglucosaminyldiphosphoundecaprenol N-acetyl-beta-D-mannosaminyltransferase
MGGALHIGKVSTPTIDMGRPEAELSMGRQSSVERFPRFSMLGFPVHALSKNDLVDLVAEAVDEGRRYIIGNHNLHSIYLSYHEPRMLEFYRRADFAHVDGMAVVLVGRLFGLPLTRTDRTGYADLLPLLAQRAAISGWRIFYLGSKPGIAEQGAKNLRSQYPQIQIQTRHGYFDAAAGGPANREILDEIQRFEPHILLVGMGMPRQELWILENLEGLHANAVFCCGALMDYVAGEIPGAPRWLGQIGLEWLYRLIMEPRRLWRRYLLEPWSVLMLLAREWFMHASRNSGAADDETPYSR